MNALRGRTMDRSGVLIPGDRATVDRIARGRLEPGCAFRRQWYFGSGSPGPGLRLRLGFGMRGPLGGPWAPGIRVVGRR